MRKIHRSQLVAIAVWASCAAVLPAVLGQETDRDHEYGHDLDAMALIELDVPEIITASRHGQAAHTVAHAVGVITAEDIRLSGVRSVPEALRLLPGVDVASLTEGVSAVSVRGMHGLRSNQLLVLVDGRQIYDAVFGGTFWGGWPFMLEDIQRIEVIRGPGGVTWGANAVNGVINVITKDPCDQDGLTVVTRGGAQGNHKTYAGYGLAEGNLRMRLSAEYEGSDGFTRGGSVLGSLDDNVKAARLGWHAVYEPEPDETLTMLAGSSAVDGLFPPTWMYNGKVQNPGAASTYISARWQRDLEPDNTLTMSGFINDFFTDLGNSITNYRYQQAAFQLGQRLCPRDGHTLSWGLDSRLDFVDTGYADPFMLTKRRVVTGIMGVYVQDEWQLLPRWSLRGGMRIDYDFYGGFEPSGRVAISHQITEDALLYGAMSRTCQMPATVRFADVPMADPILSIGADRDLAPASLLAYELGYHTWLFDRLNVNIDLYWHEYDDLYGLVPQFGPPTLLRPTFTNCASATAYGLEIDARCAVTSRLDLLANYTYERIDWRGDSLFGYTLNTDTITAPEHKFMVGARCQLTDNLHISSHLWGVDNVQAPNAVFPLVPMDVEAYLRLDIRAAYSFADDQATVAIGVQNALDPHHREGGSMFVSDAEVPRHIYAELRVSIR